MRSGRVSQILSAQQATSNSSQNKQSKFSKENMQADYFLKKVQQRVAFRKLASSVSARREMRISNLLGKHSPQVRSYSYTTF